MDDSDRLLGLLGLLADDARRRVFAAVVLGAGATSGASHTWPARPATLGP